MSIITINEKEYETDDMSKEFLDVVKVIEANFKASNLLNHTLQCVNAVGSMKLKELEILAGNDTEDGKKL